MTDIWFLYVSYLYFDLYILSNLFFYITRVFQTYNPEVSISKWHFLQLLSKAQIWILFFSEQKLGFFLEHLV